jgi:GTP pyrophosphokinase
MLLTEEGRKKLEAMVFASYMALATFLISKSRRMGGNQFRHQLATWAILIDYGVIDSVLLKAALVHDIIEELPDFNQDLIRFADADGEQVLKLVLEVSRVPGETKADFLTRILERGSRNARILKVADRLSNMHDLGIASSPDFIERYCNETEKFIFPMAAGVDRDMLRELRDLVASRRGILSVKTFREYAV